MTTIQPTPIVKYPAESFTVTFNFVPLLATGEKLTTATVVVEQFFGDDPSPNAVLSGSCQVESVAQKSVLQKIKDGVAGCIYRLKCDATTDAPNKYTLVGMLEVLG